MGKNKETKPRPKPYSGAVMTGSIPGGLDVARVIVEHDAVTDADQSRALGHPAVSVRYGLGYRDDDLYGYTYCHTDLDPGRRVAARLVTPSNCRTIEIGIVTPAGAYWSPARIMLVDDDAAARDYVRRRIGRDAPVYYWDYSLDEQNVARYFGADGSVLRDPRTDFGSEPDDPAVLLREQDDGNPNAADAAAGKDGE